jgi:hypothetical protein
VVVAAGLMPMRFAVLEPMIMNFEMPHHSSGSIA